MAEFLVKMSDGNIISVEGDDHVWGGSEGMPTFGIVKVPGYSKQDAAQYIAMWRHETSASIIASDQEADTYRIKITSASLSASGAGAFTQEQMEKFFTEWGAQIVQFRNESVTFDISVYDAITSERFWGVDTSSVVFVETLYTQLTGDHLIQVQSSPFSQEAMRLTVEDAGGTIVPPDSFVMNRAVARQRFVDDIRDRIHGETIGKRRFYVTPTGLSALQAAHGVLSVTAQQFLANVGDKLLD